MCLHQATTSASAYTLKVDAGKVQKSKQTVGTIIIDTVSEAGGFITDTGSLGANTVAGKSYRVGEYLHHEVTLKFTGAVGTWTVLSYNLPSGKSVDLQKLSQTLPGTGNLGSVYLNGTNIGPRTIIS